MCGITSATEKHAVGYPALQAPKRRGLLHTAEPPGRFNVGLCDDYDGILATGGLDNLWREL